MHNVTKLLQSMNNQSLYEELKDLVELASLMCNTPIALITEVKNNEPILAAHKGLDPTNAHLHCDFCVHNLKHQEDLVAVNDTSLHEKYKNLSLVTGSDSVRFYASSPIKSEEGHTYGAICVMDTEVRNITEEQEKALKILAKKALSVFINRDQRILQEKQIRNSATKLRKLTDFAPGVIFQLEMEENGTFTFPFVSKGIVHINSDFTPTILAKKPSLFLSKVHPDHRVKLMSSIKLSSKNLCDWRCEIQMRNSEGDYEWYIGLAQPEMLANGKVAWYGTFQNISSRKNYENTLKQIVFDISHVLRKPVTTLMGLTALIQEDDLEVENIREFCKYINTVTTELESYTRKLNDNYSKQKLTVVSKIG